MRKILILTVLMGSILSGCGIDSDISDKMKSPNYSKINEANTSSDKKEGVNNKLGYQESQKSYENLIKLISTGKKPFEIISYVDKEISKVSLETADKMILTLQEIQESFNETYYQPKFFSDQYAKYIYEASNGGMGSEIIEKVKDQELKSLLQEVFNSGYKLVSKEGYVYSVMNYSFHKKYSSYLSKEMADYIDVMAMISDKDAADDGALVISWEELSERVMKLDKYIAEHKDFIMIENVQYYYHNYISMFLLGLNNTPAYDYETKVYKEEVVKSFNSFIDNNNNTKSAQIVKAYLDSIKKNNYRFSKEASDSVFNMFKESFPKGKYSYQGEYITSNKYMYINTALSKLLPEKEGYKWIYSGFAEYGHDMELKDIIESDNEIKYVINGKVHDMSGGESGKGEDHFNIDLSYTIKNGSIIQTKSENIMMDSDFNSIELIRTPLIRGNRWLQAAVDKLGKERYLECEITDANEIGGKRVYTVKYKEQTSEYYETRMIEEGVGVAVFAKLWQSKDGNFEIGYGLNR